MIVGVLQLLSKELYIQAKPVEAWGITNVCVSAGFQGCGFGRKLMEGALKILSKRGKPLLLLFARRAVDGFYDKFGFIGTGFFPEIAVKNVCSLRPEIVSSLDFVSRPRPKLRREYSSLYAKTYSKIDFSFYRDVRWWQNVDNWLKFVLKDHEFVNVYLNGRFTGYFIRKDNRVIEAAAAGDYGLFSELIAAYFVNNKNSELSFELMPAHPLAKKLFLLNHDFKCRRSWDGGHMLRFNVPSRLSKFRLVRLADSSHAWSVVDEF